MLHESLAELLSAVVKSQRDVMVTFAVEVEHGQQKHQVPLIKPLGVRKTKEGHWVLSGYNLRRLPDDPAAEVSSRDLIRSYRIDRIVVHTLQFLYPALPPELIGQGGHGEEEDETQG